jgi:hypothetical protein
MNMIRALQPDIMGYIGALLLLSRRKGTTVKPCQY